MLVPWCQRVTCRHRTANRGRRIAISQCLPGSHPSRRFHGSTLEQPKPLTWSRLYLASRLARWAGLCYVPQDQLQDRIKAEGLELVAAGRTAYTSWYIADGCVEPNMFVSAAVRQWGLLNPDSKTDLLKHTLLEGAQGLNERRRFVFVRGVHWNAPDTDSTAVSSALMNWWPSPFRGQSNSSSRVTDTSAASSTSDSLVSHTGITALASDLLQQLSPWLLPPTPEPSQTIGPSTPTAPVHASLPQQQQQQPLTLPPSPPTTSQPQPQQAVTDQAAQRHRPQQQHQTSQQAATHQQQHSTRHTQHQPLPLSFAGHSLGGALSLLLVASLASQCKHQSPTSSSSSSSGNGRGSGSSTAAAALASTISLHQFGSPPVLAHTDGGGGHRVLQELGLKDHQVRSFVCEHDPVPRALLTADPAYQTLKQYQPVRQLLELRGMLSNAASIVTLMSRAWANNSASLSNNSSSTSPAHPQLPNAADPGSSTPTNHSSSPNPGAQQATDTSQSSLPSAATLYDNVSSVWARAAQASSWLWPGAAPSASETTSSPGALGIITGSMPVSRQASTSAAATPRTSNQPPALPTAGTQLLAAVQAVNVTPMLSLDRFVFEPVGGLYLLRGGAEVVPLRGMDDAEEILRMALADVVNQPTRALQAWLDHHHMSYAHDLETAALAALKQELRRLHREQQQKHQLSIPAQQQQRRPAEQAVHHQQQQDGVHQTQPFHQPIRHR